MSRDEGITQAGAGPEVAAPVLNGRGPVSDTGPILTPALRSVLDEWDDGELRSRLCNRLVSFHVAERRSS